MKYIDAFFNRLLDLCMILAKILLVVMTIIICIHVFYRYVLNRSIRWSEEITMMMMVYMGFLVSTYGVNIGSFECDCVFDILPEPVKRAVLKFTDAVLMVMGIVLLYFGIGLIKSTMNNLMIATHLPSAMLYGGVPISGILIAYFSFVNLTGLRFEQKKTEKGSTEHG